VPGKKHWIRGRNGRRSSYRRFNCSASFRVGLKCFLNLHNTRIVAFRIGSSAFGKQGLPLRG
jgi:hypothetical protein